MRADRCQRRTVADFLVNARETVERDTGHDQRRCHRRGLARGHQRDDYNGASDRLHTRALRRRNTVQFIRALRDPIRRGEITTTVRLWQRPHVKVGGRYALPPGQIIVTKIFEVSLADVTPELARQTGFAGVVDLLKVAKHGPGRRVFVIEFRYVEPKRTGRRPGA